MRKKIMYILKYIIIILTDSVVLQFDSMLDFSKIIQT